MIIMTLFDKMLKKSKPHIILFVTAMIIVLGLAFFEIVPTRYIQLISLGLVLLFFFLLFINLVEVTKKKQEQKPHVHPHPHTKPGTHKKR